jgi:uncharacterized protein YjdB
MLRGGIAMIRTARVTALCLALILALAQIASASAVLDRAVEIISKMETSGNYGSVGNDTNGSPSVGILQWNNGRAVSLLKKIISDDPEAAKTILGEAMYAQLSGGSTGVWTGRKLSAEEKKAVGALLKTAQGMKRQDAQAEADISVYVNNARGLGIADPNALVFYADTMHQVGSGAIKKYGVKAAELSGGYGKITLKTLYQAALVYATHTKARRTKVYNMLVADPVEGSAEAVKLPQSVSITPEDAQVLYLGSTLSLTADVSPSGAEVTYDWSTSSGSVASVSGGVVTPKNAGTATITVKTQNGKSDSVKVTVKPLVVKSVSISPSSAQTLYLGDTLALTAEVSPSGAETTYAWSTSSKSIATVSSRGVVTPRKPGKVTITVKTKNGVKDTVKVSVKAVPVASVSITGSQTMARGKKQALKAVCAPENATNKAVRWRSSNGGVAAVNSKGVVLARKKGKANIYCMTLDGTKKIGKIAIQVG